jgi:competence protein ComFA
VCTSKTENRDEVIASFRQKKRGLIVATTVLERGVTIPHADVCVFQADHAVFDEAGLIQMAGRAGRSFEDPYGDVLFLCNEKSDLCERCCRNLKEANASCGV